MCLPCTILFPTVIHVYVMFLAQVIGCHAKPFNKTVPTGLFPYQYPDDNGESCTCHYDVEHYCIATCASNIRYHEVRFQYGKGTTIVSCSAGNSVLGCNIFLHDAPSDSTECYTWSVKDAHSCECYSGTEMGATCYALCGQII